MTKVRVIATVTGIEDEKRQPSMLHMVPCHWSWSPHTAETARGVVVGLAAGDIRLVRSFTDLKLRYPDRVFLILGNRDVNKVCDMMHVPGNHSTWGHLIPGGLERSPYCGV